MSEPVTADTIVAVSMKGDRYIFPVGDNLTAPISSWATTLSDLTGYTAEHLTRTMVDGLNKRYGIEVHTAAGNLCPIRFLITKR